jgi:H+/Cl- antiporter ClcA
VPDKACNLTWLAGRLKQKSIMNKQENNWDGIDRRQTPAKKDSLYRILSIGVILGWCLFIIAMLVFHVARPEISPGFFDYKNVDSRDFWDVPKTLILSLLLGCCFLLSVAALIIRAKRARRRNDGLWLNLFFLFTGTLASLLWLIWEFI